MRTALRPGAKRSAKLEGLALGVPATQLSKRCRREDLGAALLLVAALVTGLTKQLAVLLLRHTLATLLDY
jgi:hypothetical protein